MSKNPISEFCSALKKYDRFLLSCHVVPEGDAIGSILAVDSLLRRLGKKSFVVCEDEFPERLRCLSDKRWNQLSSVKKKVPPFQALVVADCPNLDRIGSVKDVLAKDTVIFNIDHHISNIHFGDYNYVRPDAAASAEVVVDIFKYFGLKLTKEEAANLYVALATDTGCFKYSNTSIHSHRLAAEFLTTGIDIETINEQIHATYSLNKISLYSRLLSRVKTAEKGRIAWVGMRREDLKSSGATDEDTEGFIDFLKYIREVNIAFFMSEISKDGRVRVSFRSKGEYDVNRIASHFNGGGHRKASGCVISRPIKIVEKMILDCICKEFTFD